MRFTYLLDMVQARCTNNDCITVFPLHEAVVRYPAKSHLSHGQTMFLRDDLDRCQGLEVSVVPVSGAVALRYHKQRAAVSEEFSTFPCILLGSKREPGSTASSIER